MATAARRDTSFPSTNDKYSRRLEQAEEYFSTADWELAENALKDAKLLSESEGFQDAAQCQLDVTIRLAEVLRRHGKYEAAVKAGNEALHSDRIDKVKRISVLGELGVNLRHMDRITDAAETFQKQYDEASRLALELEADACRAAGNLGMAMYQLYLQQEDKSDKTKLQTSIKLLLEDRVNKSRSLQKRLQPGDRLMGKLKMWESIGVGRLSLPYAANGELEEALKWAKLCMEMTKNRSDPTMVAFSRFLYGYALLANGDEAGAKREFGTVQGEGFCTSCIAMCKELSAEHRDYLKAIIKTGVDLTAYDKQGYSALDYAVYAGDQEATTMLRNGLSVQLNDSDKAQDHYKMALLRKHFREIFNEHFRPIISLKRTDTLQLLRAKYEELLDDTGVDGNAKRDRFDSLRLISLEDFDRAGKLPHFGMDDNLSRTFQEISAAPNAERRKHFVVFISYRWLGKDADRNSTSPDDAHNTQYNRMLNAISGLLRQHSELRAQDVYIWLDCACIDQENGESGRRERGINSLPIFVAQCDAMVSLVDDLYFTRAWCGVEILIMQTLRDAAKQHRWYVHTLHNPGKSRIDGILSDGGNVVVKPSQLNLTKKSDRRNIEFLERQSMLLGASEG